MGNFLWDIIFKKFMQKILLYLVDLEHALVDELKSFVWNIESLDPTLCPSKC